MPHKLILAQTIHTWLFWKFTKKERHRPVYPYQEREQRDDRAARTNWGTSKPERRRPAAERKPGPETKMKTKINSGFSWTLAATTAIPQRCLISFRTRRQTCFAQQPEKKIPLSTMYPIPPQPPPLLSCRIEWFSTTPPKKWSELCCIRINREWIRFHIQSNKQGNEIDEKTRREESGKGYQSRVSLSEPIYPIQSNRYFCEILQLN